MDNFSKVIVALDQLSPEEVFTHAKESFGEFSILKIGLELFNKHGTDFINKVQKDLKKEIFLDLKLHDIPNTVFNAIKSLEGTSPKFLTIHLTGGTSMIRSALQARDQFLPKTKILGVSYLTSLSDADFSEIWGNSKKDELFEKAFKLANNTKIDGVVCSPHELGMLSRLAPNLIKVTPGIRMTSSEDDDQSRTLPPSKALAEGSDFLVIGRPLRDPGQKELILKDLTSYFAQ